MCKMDDGTIEVTLEEDGLPEESPEPKLEARNDVDINEEDVRALVTLITQGDPNPPIPYKPGGIAVATALPSNGRIVKARRLPIAAAADFSADQPTLPNDILPALTFRARRLIDSEFPIVIRTKAGKSTSILKWTIEQFDFHEPVELVPVDY